jgi:hypothetical protein
MGNCQKRIVAPMSVCHSVILSPTGLTGSIGSGALVGMGACRGLGALELSRELGWRIGAQLPEFGND